MSMLTPRGHSYQRPGTNRHTKLVAVGVVVALALGGTAFWLLRPSAEAKTVAAQRCPATKPLKTSDVRLKLLNATRTEGLARVTSVQFKARGFKVVSVGNVGGGPSAPTSTAAATIVHFGPSGTAEANLVALNLAHARMSADSRTGPDVEVLLGKDYTGLRPPALVIADLAKHPAPKPTC